MNAWELFQRRRDHHRVCDVGGLHRSADIFDLALQLWKIKVAMRINKHKINLKYLSKSLRSQRLLGFGQAMAGDVEAVLGVVEQAPGQRLDQSALGAQGIFGHRVGLDPVAVGADALAAVDDAQRAVGDVLVHVVRDAREWLTILF